MMEKIIGDDLLSIGERTKLIASINDVVDNTRILQDWMIEENARMKHEGQMAYVREEGLKQGIEQGTLKGIEYNIPIDVDTVRRREPRKWTYLEGIKSLIVDTKWVF